MTDSQVETEGTTTTRRAMFAGVGAVGASALLAACGTDEGDSSLADGDGGATQGAAPATTQAAAPTTGAPEQDPAGNGTKLTATSDIPVDGGKVFGDKKVVVTQPASGDFKCFTAICTHQGCTVANVKDGTINCGCHGSQYSAEDGSVKRGPATEALEEVTIKVAGDAIWLQA